MLRFHTILHPTDFSPNSDEAFHFACALARDCNARLIIVHAVEPAPAVVGEGALVPYDLVELLLEARRKIDELNPAEPCVHLETVIRDGPAPAVILDAADEFEADLIVMGTHGRTGLKRLFLGSVAELVLRSAHCPVLTVKEPGRTAMLRDRRETATSR
jgi:nucleotide-binding universal stress UspA family protein